MRHPSLHAALRAFADEASAALAAEVAAGAEVPFELATEGRTRRTPLYCYRPLTGAFIRERLGQLAGLATYAPAARALEPLEGLDVYLRTQGEAGPTPRGARDRADVVLRVFLDRVFADSSDFALSAERFERCYGELENVVDARETSGATLVVGLPGLRLASPEVPLAHGVVLHRADALPDAPPEAAWLGASGEEANALAVLTLADALEAEAAPARLRRLVRALRLYDAGAVGLAPVGWARLGGGAWQIIDLGGGSPTRTGEPLSVAPEQEDELRAFVALAARRMPRGGELAWALRRFDLACEREDATEALTDLLLALRALLEPEGPQSGHLPRRLAALCAPAEERDALAARIVDAIGLEHSLVAGLAPPASGVDEVTEDLTEHLRALLGDALCGHLETDLAGAAENLLARSTAPSPLPTS